MSFSTVVRACESSSTQRSTAFHCIISGRMAEDETVLEPTDRDVLLDKGGASMRTFLHPGNILFRRLIDENLTVYLALTSSSKKSKKAKSAFIDNIRKIIEKGGGRFLKKRDITKAGHEEEWYIVSPGMVHEKTGRALRHAKSIYERKHARNPPHGLASDCSDDPKAVVTPNRVYDFWHSVTETDLALVESVNTETDPEAAAPFAMSQNAETGPHTTLTGVTRNSSFNWETTISNLLTQPIRPSYNDLASIEYGRDDDPAYDEDDSCDMLPTELYPLDLTI